MTESHGERVARLHEKYHEALVGRLMRDMGLGLDDARDISSMTFIKLLEAGDTFRDEGAWSYLVTTARNLVFNENRAVNAQKRSGVMVPLDDVQPPGRELPADVVLIRREQTMQARQELRDAIGRLPPQTAQAFRLRLHGASYAEIETTMNLSPDSVKSRLADARRRVHALVGEIPEGIDWSEIADEDDHDQIHE